VGHETDVTLADLVADVRAPTPSAAAELISPDREQLQRLLGTLAGRLVQLQRRRIGRESERLTWLLRRLRHPGTRLRDQAQRLDEIAQRLEQAMTRRITLATARLGTARATLRARSPRLRLEARDDRLTQLRLRLHAAARRALALRSDRLAHLGQLLESVSPLATLSRGYAIASDLRGGVLRDAAQVQRGDRIRTRLASGTLECTVDDVLSPD
jgi:exodeoxyribonuclease VII large subunit